MPFFFKNKTTCKICNSAIQELKDAVVLDYVNVEKYPEFAPFVRSYVHRAHFAEWSLRDTYINAAFELVLVAIKEERIFNVLFADNKLLITHRDKSFSLRDYSELLELIIKYEDFKSLSIKINELVSNSLEEISYDNWKMKSSEEMILFTRFRNGEVIDEKLICKKRVSLWVSDEIFDVIFKISG